MIPDALISRAYCREQVLLHARPAGYGGKGGKWAAAAVALAEACRAQSLLDYGCGRGQLADCLRQADVSFAIREYDPAIPGKDMLPEPADVVVCTDVLEHIEPEKLTAVLAHVKRLTRKAALLVVATRPSGKTLTDGRNAHLILESDDWWAGTVTAAGFTLHEGPVSPLKKRSREWVAVATPSGAV